MFFASHGKRRRAALRRSQILAAAGAEVLEDRALLSAVVPTAAAVSTTTTNAATAPKVRSIDGSGNNLQHTDWGKAGTDLVRKAPAEYTDGKSSPAGTDRPSPREISNALVDQGGEDVISDRGLAAMIYAWGQFIDHDLDLVRTNSAEPLSIAIPKGDPQFDTGNTGTQTMNTSRSVFDPLTGTSTSNPRQQINSITSWIDGSMVYGSDTTTADSLRTKVGRLLKTSEGNLLPKAANGSFIAGDIRANENPELTSLQTLFVREHNQVAARLAKQNPSWNDERLYQEARAVVIAEIESITYNEWLPALLGQGALDSYRGYKANVNPGIANEFAAAGFRLGHSLLGDDIEFLDNNGNPIADEVALRDAFFNPGLVSQNGIDSILKYLASDPSSELDTKIVDGVRNFLSPAPGVSGFDLASLNIVRGRDHGLPDYNAVRQSYGLRPVTSFAQISSDREVQTQLRELYGSVDNIDLWVGALAENHVRGASVGPTLRAIVSDQFERLRDGDRFWYERQFSGAQLRQIQNTSLTDVIKRNTTLTNLQSNAFFFRASVSGTVYADRDGNGRQSRNEQPLAGRKLELVEVESGEVLATTTSNRSGQYRFDVEDGIRTGKYLVRDAAAGLLGASQRQTFSITRGDQNVSMNISVRRNAGLASSPATTDGSGATLRAQSVAGQSLGADSATTVDDGSASLTKKAVSSSVVKTDSSTANSKTTTSQAQQKSTAPLATELDGLDSLFASDELDQLLTTTG